jgi:hypothetical protein
MKYVKRWVPEVGAEVPAPIVEHKFGRGGRWRLFGRRALRLDVAQTLHS